MIIHDLIDRLNALGLRIPADAETDLALGPDQKAAEIRAIGGRLIAKSRVAANVRGGDIESIAKKMHALAQKTDPKGAPKLALGPPPRHGTNLQFRDGKRWKKRYIEEDAWAWKPYLDHLAQVFHEESWPWRFVETAASPAEDDLYERLLLVPASVVAPLSKLAFVRAGNPPDATPAGDGAAPIPEVQALRSPADVIGAQHYLSGDTECVDSASDYVGVVTDLAALTDGALRPDDVGCVERDGARQLTFAAAGRRYEVHLRGDTDWLDLPPLLACLNRVLADAGAPGRLHEQNNPFGDQGFAVVYATAEQVRALEAEGCDLVRPATR